jgi:hypothetical protein
MMDDCREEERRADYPALLAAIARIDERTLMILKGQEKLATVESVKHVNGRIDRHIKSHITKGGLFVSWAGIAVAIGVGFMGLWKK